MTPYCLVEGFIGWEHAVLCRAAASLVHWYPNGLTCHEVCERLAKELPGVAHVRGKFNGYDHSWLTIDGTQLVIDAYPWACGSGPILVDCQTGSPWATLYRDARETTGGKLPWESQ